jgi:hypothetical protein
MGQNTCIHFFLSAKKLASLSQDAPILAESCLRNGAGSSCVNQVCQGAIASWLGRLIAFWRRAWRSAAPPDSGGSCRGIDGRDDIRVHPVEGQVRAQRLQLGDGELPVLIVEDSVLALAGAMDGMKAVWLTAHELGGNLLWKKYLPGVRCMARFIRSP